MKPFSRSEKFGGRRGQAMTQVLILCTIGIAALAVVTCSARKLARLTRLMSKSLDVGKPLTDPGVPCPGLSDYGDGGWSTGVRSEGRTGTPGNPAGDAGKGAPAIPGDPDGSEGGSGDAPSGAGDYPPAQECPFFLTPAEVNECEGQTQNCSR